jgi:AraC-like DNA-binding protein
VRRELVLRYMETPSYSMGQIAALLGYASPGSFTRWFIAQFGVSPISWRRSNTTGLPASRRIPAK